ncbi:NepR family anti-sigma factor [Acuticoccus sp.]|uniref:NepR family anti-sigma factor n=1 Tax=Acuticoccus sp. TaxID=1904378 RepID=UPI003B516FAE
MANQDEPNGSRDDAMQSLIGKQLRNLYDTVLVEPIPDKLVELLLKLDDATSDRDERDDEPSEGTERR